MWYKNYYVFESVGIVIGFLIVVLYNVGLLCLMYILNLMKFFNGVLDCFDSEKLVMIFMVGYVVDIVIVFEVVKYKKLFD